VKTTFGGKIQTHAITEENSTGKENTLPKESSSILGINYNIFELI